MSAKDWVDIVTGGITAAVLVFGTFAAIWKFIIQQPTGNNWRVSLTPCRVRKVVRNGHTQLMYTVSLIVENGSTAGQNIYGWWRIMRFPDESNEEYNPDRKLPIRSDEDAIKNFGFESIVKSPYPLAPGEKYVDQMFRRTNDKAPQICFVEYSMKYREWKRHWLIIPYRGWQRLNQIMIAPVEREDTPTLERDALPHGTSAHLRKVLRSMRVPLTFALVGPILKSILMSRRKRYASKQDRAT